MIRLAASFAFLLCASLAWAKPPILSATEAQARMQAGDLVVLDIRTPEEWAETGVAEGAWPVSMHLPDFGKLLNAILSQYPTDQIALICATGGRSSYIAGILEQNGITGIADLSEGMFGNPNGPGWIARGLPVVSTEQAGRTYENALEN